MVEELTSELLERVQDGTLDLALLALPIPGGHFVCQELFRERLYLVVPESHRLSSHSMVHLKQVERDPFRLLKDGHCFRENTLSACGRARLRPNVVFESGQFTTILAVVGGGTGVSVVPQMAVERRKGCRFIPIADEGAYRRVGIVQPRVGNSVYQKWAAKFCQAQAAFSQSCAHAISAALATECGRNELISSHSWQEMERRDDTP